LKFISGFCPFFSRTANSPQKSELSNPLNYRQLFSRLLPFLFGPFLALPAPKFSASLAMEHKVLDPSAKLESKYSIFDKRFFQMKSGFMSPKSNRAT